MHFNLVPSLPDSAPDAGRDMVSYCDELMPVEGGDAG